MLKNAECPHCSPPVSFKAEQKPKRVALSEEEKLLKRSQKFFNKIKENSNGKISAYAYTGAKENLMAHCNECGNEWCIRADHLLMRAHCPLCKKAKHR
jgi:hypothetical protein